MHECLKSLSELDEVTNIIFYGSYSRGDSDGTDIDTLVFTKGERYCTPIKVYYYTAKLPRIYDVFIHNKQELKGVAVDLFSPVFVEHLADVSEPFSGEDLKEIFRDKTNIWEKTSKKSGISWGYFSELSDRVRHLRKGYEQIIKNPPDTRTEEGKIIYKKEANRAFSTMRIAVRMKGIRLGRFDDKKNVIKTYYENYPIIKDHENIALKIANDDFSKLSLERALENTEISKELGEEVLWAVDRDLCQKLGI